MIEQRLEEKYNTLGTYVENQPPEDAIRVRVQQFSLAKILVNVHRKSPFLMVKTTTNLG